MFDIVMSVVVITALLLLAGAIFLFRKGHRKQALLMVILAAVMIANVAIWVIPTEGGDSLADAAARGEE